MAEDEVPAGLTGKEVKMDFKRQFCALHGEPFQAKWPEGAIVFGVKAFQKATGHDAFWETAKKLEVAGEENAEQRSMERALDKKPACCWLSLRELLELYEESSIAVKKRCPFCNRKRLGAPYRVNDQDGVLQTFEHVCFECVCTKFYRLS